MREHEVLSHCIRAVTDPAMCGIHGKPMYTGWDPFALDVDGIRVLVVACSDGFADQADEI